MSKLITQELSRSLLSSIAESSEDAIIGLTLEGDIISWNYGAEKTYGYNANEILGRHISILIPEDRLEFTNSIIRRVKNKERIERYEAGHIKKDGERIVVSLTVSYFHCKKNDIEGASIVSRDITPSKLSEEALKESENFNKTILSSVKRGIVVIDDQGRIKLWNKYMEDLTCIKSIDAIWYPALEKMTFLAQDLFSNLFTKALMGHTTSSYRTSFFSENIPGFQPDANQNASNKWLSVSFAPHYSLTGQIVGAVATVSDISEQIEAEENLYETNVKLSALINSSPVAIFIIDTQKKITLWNPTAEKMFNYKKDEIIETHIPILPSKSNEIFEELFQSVLNGNIESNYEILLQRKNNIYFDASLSTSPLFDNSGEIIGIISIVIDISKRKNFEKALQESKKRFIELYDNMSSGVIFYEGLGDGDDFLIKDLNPAAERIEKTNKETIIQKKLSDLVRRDLNAGLFEAFKRVWSTGNPEEYLFTFYADNNNIVGWRKNYIYKLPSGEIVAIFDDTTEKMASDERLKESEERYRSFVQNFKGIAFRWTLDYYPLLFHGSVKEITGYDEKDFTDRRIKWDDIILPEDLQSIKLQSDKVGVMPNYEHDFEYRIINKNSETVWVHEHLQNICGDDNKLLYIQGTIYNITERKKAEFDLKRSQEQFRNLAMHLETAREEEKKRIALEIHDELGHALTALKLDLAWLLKKKFLKREALLDKIQTMYDLIEVTIRKVRLISTELRPSVLDHFGLVAAIEWQAKEFQKRTGCRTRLTINPTEITVDEYRATALFRIFQEILTNVARHANASRVDVNLEVKDNIIYLKISDNGKGIKQDQIASVKSFGLIGMNERANALGGNLTISGISGIGTTITVKVPIKDNF